MTQVFHWLEKAVLAALTRLGGKGSYDQLAEKVSEVLRESGSEWRVNRESRISSVAKACGWLRDKGLVSVEEAGKERFVALDSEGIEYAVNGLPERKVVNYLQMKGEATVEEISALPRSEIGLMWARRRGWVDFVKKNSTTFVILKENVPDKTDVEKFLESLYTSP
ncbi:MAG: hypothetical protein NZ921_03350, partial [Candidatus Caldarchaeum sp.]|nr:hypothetical protein [Candidatus Caldarchaeum sp.]